MVLTNRGNPFQFGVLLLAYQLLTGIGITNIPPVTLVTLVVQVALFTGHLDFGWGPPSKTCLNLVDVFFHKQYSRIITSALVHANDIHLYYNMTSLVWKGRDLEHKFGSKSFAFILVFFTIATGLVHLALTFFASEILDDPSFLNECSVGFSGVLFALKVLANHYVSGLENQRTFLFGVFLIPMKLLPWMELLLIQIMVPNASFLGHLAGIVVGVTFIAAIPSLRLMFSPIQALRYRPITVLCIAFFSAIQFDWVDKPWVTSHFWTSGTSLVCISGRLVVDQKNFVRIISAPLEHASEIHFMICLISFILKGYELEKSNRSLQFLFKVIFSLLLTGVVYSLLTYLIFTCTLDRGPFTECVQGLSGPLFALKALVLYNAESFTSPAMLFEAFELLFLLEERTLWYHVSGLITGFLVILLTSKQRFPGTGSRTGHWESPHDGSHLEIRTRSWGYAHYPPDAFWQRHSQERGEYESLASSHSRLDSFSPLSQNSVTDNESGIARGTLDASHDASQSPLNGSNHPSPGRFERSATPSPSAPPYDPQWDREPPEASYPPEGTPPPPPQGWTGFHIPDAPNNSNRESPDVDELRRRRLERFA